MIAERSDLYLSHTDCENKQHQLGVSRMKSSVLYGAGPTGHQAASETNPSGPPHGEASQDCQNKTCFNRPCLSLTPVVHAAYETMLCVVHRIELPGFGTGTDTQFFIIWHTDVPISKFLWAANLGFIQLEGSHTESSHQAFVFMLWMPCIGTRWLPWRPKEE